jgi:enamine deaminase RidA (YjgF/YER057c/UK114 family)
MKMQHIKPDGLFSIPTYTQLVTVQDAKLLFLAGQVAWDEQGNVVGAGDFQAQTVQVFENIKRALASANADFSHVIKLTVYVVNLYPELRGQYREIHERYISHGNNPPASTLLGVQALALPELMIEIDVVAAVPLD